MRKIDLIIESIRDEYMINLLEEGSVSELESLKTKKFLNENLNRIRKMLVEEGALDGVKNHLANNWGKYLGGAGALGAAGALGSTDTASDLYDIASSEGSLGDKAGYVGEYMNAPADVAKTAAEHLSADDGMSLPMAGRDDFDSTKAGAFGNPKSLAAQAGDYASGLGDRIGGSYDQIVHGGASSGAVDIGNAISDAQEQVRQGNMSQADFQSMVNAVNSSANSGDMNMLAGEGLGAGEAAGLGGAAAAGLGGAGYGAKKLYDRYKK